MEGKERSVITQGVSRKYCTGGSCLQFSHSILLSMLFLFQPWLLVSDSGNAQAFVYWTNKDGSASSFDWYDGGSDNGRFGNPNIIGGNTFMFTPSNFRAESVNGVPAIKSDRFEVCLEAHEGYAITGIRITEYGDYGILGTGKVSVSGTMFATDLINLNPLGLPDVRSGSFVGTPPSPISSGTGEWSAQATITNLNWTNLKLVLNNNLMAISSLGSISFIEKKVVGGAVAIEILSDPPIPEPATVCLLGFGVLSLVRRKKINSSMEKTVTWHIQDERRYDGRIQY